MSPEGKEYLYRYVQKERIDKETEKARRVVNASKNWGVSYNKSRSAIGVWRK